MKKITLVLMVFSFALMTGRLSFAGSEIFYESFQDQESLIANGCVNCDVTEFVPGIVGNAAFLGPDSNLTYPVANNLIKDEGTISFWVKVRNASQKGGFFEWGDIEETSSLGVFTNQNTYIEITSDDENKQQSFIPGVLSTEDWTNITVVYRMNHIDANIHEVYVNGNGFVHGRQNFNPFLFNPTDALFKVGRTLTPFYGVANADIDELRIYDYAMMVGEIKKHYVEAIGYIPPDYILAKPVSTGPVKITRDGTLTVNCVPFFMKGVGYQPIPIGETVGYDFFKPEIYERDFPLLRAMGANSIRTWANVTNTAFLDTAWNNGIAPIYVAMGFFVPTNYCDNGINFVPCDYSDPDIRNTYKNKLEAYINKFKDIDDKVHPAVLMWVIGNENNLHYNGNMRDWYKFANELAQKAYEVEGNVYHPVAVVNGDLGYIGDMNFKADDLSLDYVDVWGINAYRGFSYADFLDEYKLLSSKPLWVSEFGIDALDNTGDPKQPYEPTQAEWVANMYQELAASDITIGASVMEYCDEWWKDGDPNNQSTRCAYYTLHHPDGCSNEEWWGIMQVVADGSNHDKMEPRLVYDWLQGLWENSDSDGDGIPDGDRRNPCTGGNAANCDDNCMRTPNPDQADADNDGTGDVCDNCYQTPNSCQQDTNYPEDDNPIEPGVQHYGNACDCDLDNDGFVGPNDSTFLGRRWWTSAPWD